MIVLSEKIKEQVIKRYQSGASLADLVREFGYSNGVYKRTLKENKIEILSDSERKLKFGKYKQDRDLLELKINNILSLLNEGKSLQETLFELKLDVNYDVAYRKIKSINPFLIDIKNNGKSKTSKIGFNKKRKISDTEENIKLIKELYENKEQTLEKIGKKFNASSATVMYFCKSNSIKMRTKTENMEIRLRSKEYREKLIEYGHLSYKSRRVKDTCYEESFKKFLEENEIIYFEQWRRIGNKHPYDFLLPEYNLLVEIDGSYWHEMEKQKTKDLKQMEEAKEKGYNIIRITSKQLKTENYNIIINRELEKIYDRSFNFK